MLKIKKKGESAWDLIALGEVMLRFDPGDERIQTARSFRVWEGGGEYNVARTLAHCFRARASVVTAFADNHIGRLVEDLIRQGGVDTSNIIWRDVDGISGNVRNGLNFVERGFGPRPPAGCSDRANTAVSKLVPDDLDLRTLFERQGTRWFHTGGIFTALSENCQAVALAAMRAARASGAVVSYDLNFRESLWSGRGGRAAANEVNRHLLAEADVVFGVEGFDPTLDGSSIEEFDKAAKGMLERHPNLQAAATSLRDVVSASEHSVGGAIYIDGASYVSREFKNVRVLDRVGSGDAFASGVIYGMLNGLAPQRYIDLASANAAYAMTCPGDTSTATLADLERMLDSGTGEIKR